MQNSRDSFGGYGASEPEAVEVVEDMFLNL